MYIKRNLELEIRKHLSGKEILAVLGPRQCGKTTMLRQLFQELSKAIFLDFEDQEMLELFTRDIKSFAKLYAEPYQYLFIDEFQYAPEGGKQLKYLYDHTRIKIIISGSSVSGLSIHGLQYLVGRVFLFHLYPFTFEEYLLAKDAPLCSFLAEKKISPPIISRILPHVQQFCLYGGYPRVVLAESQEEKETVLRNLYNTYILKEVKEILQLPGDHKFRKLLQVIALQEGNMVNCQELCQITEFKYSELKNYLNILEKTFVTISCLPYFTNKRTELVKSPKIYFLDSGFRNVLLKNFQELSKRVDKGALYEAFVAAELAKAGLSVKYWRSKSGAEVDFVVEQAGKLFALEVKSGIPRTRSLQHFLEKYPAQGYVLGEHPGTKPLFQVISIVKG
ncbi:ATP-binding protein [Candidatus Woesearchaeota archaeon]|nr:ATP-binding protein [Candidatus Woesearchaeota archaeon]